MAATGFTPVQLYHSTTAAATPSAGNLANGELAVNITDGKLFYKDNGGVVRVLATAAGAAGDVVGPASATDNALARFDTTTGKLIQNSVAILSDAGVLTGLTGLTSSGNVTLSSLTATRVPYASTGGLLVDSANMTFNGTRLTVADLADSGLTATRVVYSTTGGALVDSANMTFDGTRLTVADLADSGLTSGRVTYASTGGALVDSANLTFDGTNLTLGGGTANAVAYLNGSKILTTGSALTFNGSTLLVPTGGVESGGAAGAGFFTAYNTDAVNAQRIIVSMSGTNAVLNATRSSGTQPQMLFQIDGSEQMRLTSTGLGIGTSSPAARLSVRNTGAQVDISSSATNVTFESINRAATTNPIDTLFYTRNGTFQWFNSSYTERMRLDASGNLGLGVTPSAWGVNTRALQMGDYAAINSDTVNGAANVSMNAFFNGTNWIYRNSSWPASYYNQTNGLHRWFTAPSGTAGNAISFTQAMTLDASGNLFVGTTSQLFPASVARLNVDSGALGTATFKTSGGSAQATLYSFNSATTGDNAFISFGTEGTWTGRGGITYNRAGGLVVYGTTSDYRAKDISGPLTDSGALIDSVPVYMGKMKGATQERPMFIAHETPDYAHTGVKDAVDADGNPVYQQMDAASLVPVMWAEIQSLRQRLAAAGI